MRRECRERFPRYQLQRKPLVSDPGMHHGTCVTHVLWCMYTAKPRWRVKRFRNSRHMRNSQFYASVRRAIVVTSMRGAHHHTWYFQCATVFLIQEQPCISKRVPLRFVLRTSTKTYSVYLGIISAAYALLHLTCSCYIYIAFQKYNYALTLGGIALQRLDSLYHKQSPNAFPIFL